MNGIYGIHHLCINTRNMDESLAFYQELIGFTLLGREHCAFGEYAMLSLNGSRLELIQPANPDEKNSFGNCGSLTHFGLAVHNIDETVAELRAKGVRLRKSLCRSSHLMAPSARGCRKRTIPTVFAEHM